MNVSPSDMCCARVSVNITPLTGEVDPIVKTIFRPQ
jgi:hypothetical protein